MHIVEDIRAGIERLLTSGYKPAYLILGRETYLLLRQYGREVAGEAWARHAGLPLASDRQTPSVDTFEGLTIVVDPGHRFYLSVAPRPDVAALMT